MKKNTFLYIVIAVLVIALAGLGALNVRSLDKLASLQTKVNKLQKSVQEVSDSAAELSSKADQLDALYPDDPTVSSAAAAASSAEVQVLPHRKNPQIHLQPPILPKLLAARTVLLPLRKKERFPHPAEALSQTIRIPAWTTF